MEFKGGRKTGSWPVCPEQKSAFGTTPVAHRDTLSETVEVTTRKKKEKSFNNIWNSSTVLPYVKTGPYNKKAFAVFTSDTTTALRSPYIVFMFRHGVIKINHFREEQRSQMWPTSVLCSRFVAQVVAPVIAKVRRGAEGSGVGRSREKGPGVVRTERKVHCTRISNY